MALSKHDRRTTEPGLYWALGHKPLGDCCDLAPPVKAPKWNVRKHFNVCRGPKEFWAWPVYLPYTPSTLHVSTQQLACACMLLFMRLLARSVETPCNRNLLRHFRSDSKIPQGKPETVWDKPIFRTGWLAILERAERLGSAGVMALCFFTNLSSLLKHPKCWWSQFILGVTDLHQKNRYDRFRTVTCNSRMNMTMTRFWHLPGSWQVLLDWQSVQMEFPHPSAILKLMKCPAFVSSTITVAVTPAPSVARAGSCRGKMRDALISLPTRGSPAWQGISRWMIAALDRPAKRMWMRLCRVYATGGVPTPAWPLVFFENFHKLRARTIEAWLLCSHGAFYFLINGRESRVLSQSGLNGGMVT